MALTRDAFVVFALGESNDAPAPRRVFVGLAIGVRSTGDVVAWIDATPTHAGQVILALVVAAALLLGGGYQAAAARVVGLADGSPRALACVAALGVLTVGPVAARIVGALVNVDAAVLRITLVARLAHALWRIAGRALGVDSTWETFARI